MDIIERDVWGASMAKSAHTHRGDSTACVVHHTAGEYVESEEGKPGAKWYAIYSSTKASLAVKKAVRAYEKRKDDVEAAEKRAMRAIQQSHFARGFKDIGYHAVCFPSGRVYRGRPLWAVGAHCLNANHEIGFSFAGNYEEVRLTDRQLRSWTDFKHEYVSTIRGHYRVPGNATACPGRYVKMALGI